MLKPSGTTSVNVDDCVGSTTRKGSQWLLISGEDGGCYNLGIRWRNVVDLQDPPWQFTALHAAGVYAQVSLLPVSIFKDTV
jgi:hypothetical protein